MKKLIWLLQFCFYLWKLFTRLPDYGAGMKFNLNEDGSSTLGVYLGTDMGTIQFLIVLWTETVTNNLISVSEELVYCCMLKSIKIFLILTHIGLNSLNSNTMSPYRNRRRISSVLHDAWAQYSLGKTIMPSGGLHYWNGISRLNNQSTLNLMTLDSKGKLGLPWVYQINLRDT
jgi:hypothetical protein